MKQLLLFLIIVFNNVPVMAEGDDLNELVSESLAIYDKIIMTEQPVKCKVGGQVKSYILNKSLVESNRYFEKNEQRIKFLVSSSLSIGNNESSSYGYLGLIILYMFDFSTYGNLDDDLIIFAEKKLSSLSEFPTEKEMKHLNRIMPKIIGEEYWLDSDNDDREKLVAELVKNVLHFLKLKEDQLGSKNEWLNDGQKNVECGVFVESSDDSD